MKGELSLEDSFILWETGEKWKRTLNTNGKWVVAQNQPTIKSIPGTGVKKGTQLLLQQTSQGIISSKQINIDDHFSVNGKFFDNSLTITGNFPFGLGLGWLEHTSFALQWHANRFNRVIDLTGNWLDRNSNAIHEITQLTPDPIKEPSIGTLTINGNTNGRVNRNWVSTSDNNGIVDATTNTIHFDNGDCWARSR